MAFVALTLLFGHHDHPCCKNFFQNFPVFLATFTGPDRCLCVQPEMGVEAWASETEA